MENWKVQGRLQLIVFMWGFTGIMGKLITLSSIPLVFYRMGIAVLAIGAFVIIRKKSVRLSKKDTLMLLGVGGIIALHWLFFFYAIKISNVSVALSTLSTGALFTALLEPLFFKRKIAIYEILLSGVVIICLWLIFKASPHFLYGILYGIFCSFLSALFSVINAKVQVKIPAIKVVFYELIGGFVIIGSILFYNNLGSELLNINPYDWIWLIVLGGLLTAYPMIESVDLMKHISPYTLLLTINLEPVYGIILAYFIFGESEKMSLIFYIATAVMISVILINGMIKMHLKKKRSTLLTD